MSSSSGDNQTFPLTSILINALKQSQALVRQLEEQSRTIDLLERENERLMQELETTRATKPVNDGKEEFPVQLDQFFRKDAEKQAEIDRLKKELQAVQTKERKWRIQNPQIASPLVSDDVDAVPSSSPLRSPLYPTVTEVLNHQGSSPTTADNAAPYSSPPKKRQRTGFVIDSAFQELPNARYTQRQVDANAKGRANRGAEAIPIVTEDGEDHNRKIDGQTKDHKASEKRDKGAHTRLGALLSTPSAGHSVLSRSEVRSSRSASPVAKTSGAPALRKSSTDLVQDAVLAQERPMTRFLPPKRRLAPGPADDELLRSRPVSRLNLSHFKLNPNVNNRYDFAFDETVRNREDRRCLPGCTRLECCGGQMAALAATLGPEARLSDDDLLLYLLGPGSEDRIRSLTAIARENLVHEARAKRVADMYGKMHRNMFERAQSPIGFWSVDMAGPREEQNNREDAKRREREEVERRHREACRDGGKWVFADE